MKKIPLPLGKVYQLLEPGPVVMVTTADKKKQNIMTMSWLTMIDFEPPIIGCIISNRNFSFNILKASKECVINIPNVKIAKQVVQVGNSTGRKVDKFKTFHLTPVPATEVKPPLIDECFANLECKLIDMKMAAKYNLFILKVVKAWISPGRKNQQTIHHRGNGVFMVAGKDIRIASRMK